MIFSDKQSFIMKIFYNFLKYSIVLLLLTSIFGCGLYKKTDAKNVPVGGKERARKNVEEGRGFSLNKLGKGRKAASTTYEFATSNSMWRASLEILDFVPLSNVDYSGGIIITDWFPNEDVKNNSLKITVKFLSNEIRADGLDVIIHQKNCSIDNICETSKISSNISDEIRNTILKKAVLLEKNTTEDKAKN